MKWRINDIGKNNKIGLIPGADTGFFFSTSQIPNFPG